MPPSSPSRQRPLGRTAPRFPEVLDVHLAVQLLTVSADTIYDLFQRGDLPGRKVAHHQNGGAEVAGAVGGATGDRCAGACARAGDCPRRHDRLGGRSAHRHSAARDQGLTCRALSGAWAAPSLLGHHPCKARPRGSVRGVPGLLVANPSFFSRLS
jgi:hypothetical protein